MKILFITKIYIKITVEKKHKTEPSSYASGKI